MRIPAKRKKCRNCRKLFEPYVSSLQLVCSTFCGIQYGKTDKGQAEVKKAQRRELRDYRSKNESLGSLTKKAQDAFNRYIRARDVDKPCISCDKTDTRAHLTGSGWDCGHYRTVGAQPQLRFEPLNAAKQCVKCNQHLGGNTVEYGIRLRKRIGLAQFAWLEGPHDPKRYRHDDLIEIRKKFERLTKELIKRREAE